MQNEYAILCETNGWLLNLVRWDGDLSKWQPPKGTKAVLLSEINLQDLPQKPKEEIEE